MKKHDLHTNLAAACLGAFGVPKTSSKHKITQVLSSGGSLWRSRRRGNTTWYLVPVDPKALAFDVPQDVVEQMVGEGVLRIEDSDQNSYDQYAYLTET